jgi:hypothetical protein
MTLRETPFSSASAVSLTRHEAASSRGIRFHRQIVKGAGNGGILFCEPCKPCRMLALEMGSAGRRVPVSRHVEGQRAVQAVELTDAPWHSYDVELGYRHLDNR